jgi:hypothetical protein
MAAIRVMATCMAMGEAAGRAAAMAARDGRKTSEIDVRRLQRELLRNGAYLREHSVEAVAEAESVRA